MKNWTKRRVVRFGAPAVLIVFLAGCGGEAAESGVLPEGPPAGEVAALEYDRATDRLLRAHAGALYESTDGGAIWRGVPIPAAVQQGQLSAVAAADSGRVLYVAGPGAGVYRSADGGTTWVPRNEGLPSRDVAAFATHVTQDGTLYASIPEEGIYRSEDAGQSWTKMDGGPGVPVRRFFHSDMKGSMQTGWLFAATPEGVRRSMDCFCGWRPTGELPAGEVLDVAYDPRQPERVFASTASGVFRSTDGGESWAAVQTEGSVPAALAVDASGVLYGATREGALLRSADQGESWERIGA